MIKIFIRGLLLGLAICFLITYSMGWYDLINNDWLTGNWLKDFYKSITYYFGWVLVYWWLFILSGSLLMGFVATGIYWITKVFRK